MAQPAAERPIGFGLRLGHTRLAPATTMQALRSAIDESNRRFRLEGLPDSLNPDIVDADKAAALVAALPAIAHKAPQLLAGRELLLNHAPMQVGSADPTTAASFTRAFDLEIVEVQGETLLARTTVPAVPALARERSAEARTRLLAESARVVELEARLSAAEAVEAQRKVLDELTPSRSRRSALARTWWINARALSERPDADAASKADTAAAQRAAADYAMPSGVGMPS